MTKLAISVKNLTKKYKHNTAVDSISFEVEEGSMFAFLGTNGAGKSTTINMLTGVIEPTAGDITINGKKLTLNNLEGKKEIGVVFQQSILDPLMTVRENLLNRASFYKVKDAAAKVDSLADIIDMHEFLDRGYGKLSGGQKRRADIARALIHDPSILFLDEPTAGLDPKSRESVWSTINGLRKDANLTVFLTTHYMEETEKADMICVIDRGRIVSSGTPQSLRAGYSSNVLTLVAKNKKALAEILNTEKVEYQEGQGKVTIIVESYKDALNILSKAGNVIDDFEFRHGSMDDVFLNLTDKKEGGSDD